MIHKKYLEQSLRIRKDFVKTDDELLSIVNDLKKINESIQSTLAELVKIRDKSSEFDNDTFNKEVLKKLEEFEQQAKMIEDLYKPINDKMESLKKEESKLYETLVKKYPQLNEEDIVKTVHNYLRENI